MRFTILIALVFTLAPSSAKDPKPEKGRLERELEVSYTGLRSRKSEDKQAAAKEARLLGRRLFGLANNLAKNLDDADEEVRYAAVNALYEIGPVAYHETGRIANRLSHKWVQAAGR